MPSTWRPMHSKCPATAWATFTPSECPLKITWKLPPEPWRTWTTWRAWRTQEGPLAATQRALPSARLPPQMPTEQLALARNMPAMSAYDWGTAACRTAPKNKTRAASLPFLLCASSRGRVVSVDALIPGLRRRPARRSGGRCPRTKHDRTPMLTLGHMLSKPVTRAFSIIF